MQIVGHSKQRKELEQEQRPPVVLLHGPSGVGKWSIALDYADRHGGAAIIMRDEPTVEQARQVVELYRQRPIGGRFTVTLIDLDRCGLIVQHTLLKTMEEMPEWGQFVMVASRHPLATVVSRSHRIEFKPLLPREVFEVLRMEGYSPQTAEALTHMASGSIERAINFHESVSYKNDVLTYVGALIRHDRGTLSIIANDWGDVKSVLLWRWINEVLADWSGVFTREELGLVHKLGVDKFYRLVQYLQEGNSPDLAARKLWS